MLPIVLLLSLYSGLLISPSLQVPVKSKAAAKTSPSLDDAATIKPPLYDFINSRPLLYKKKALAKFHKDFASHPDVKQIKLDGDKVEIAKQFQALRGNLVDSSWHRKMTMTVKDYLENQKASKEVIEAVSAYNHDQRRFNIRKRQKEKVEAMTDQEWEEYHRLVLKQKRRTYQRGQERDKVFPKENAKTLEEVFKNALDQYMDNNDKVDGTDISMEADKFRSTHFKNEHVFRAAFKNYLQGKNVPSEEIDLILAKRRQRLDKESSQQFHLLKKTKFASSSKEDDPASTSNVSPDRLQTGHSSSLSSPSAAGQTSPIAAKSGAGTVDRLDETRWWDREGW